MTAQTTAESVFEASAPVALADARIALSGRESPGNALRSAFNPEIDAFDTIVERVPYQRRQFSLLEEMFVERGCKDDWVLLHDLHYKNSETLPIGPKFWKLTLDDKTIGVLVTASPKGLLAPRHDVFPKLRPGKGETRFTNTQRYKHINQNFRVISRFVVDTMFRGIGCGYRMMNLVSRMEGPRFMEIQSSMSRYNRFGEQAGFAFTRPANASKYEQGMKFFRTQFVSSPQDYEAIVNEVLAKSPAEQERILEMCKTFYYRHSALEKVGNNRANGKDRVDGMDIRAVIKAIQQITLASPLYGIYQNPDKGLEVPQRLPLVQFDRQATTAPLKL